MSYAAIPPTAACYWWKALANCVIASDIDQFAAEASITEGYNPVMDDQDFRRLSDESLESLKRSLYEAEGEADFEVEDNAGALHINFDEPPGKFVISPNAPVRQIWISALSTSFKLDWSSAKKDFILTKTGEGIKKLVNRLINEQLGEHAITLK
jgi:iron donor protein CyaY